MGICFGLAILKKVLDHISLRQVSPRQDLGEKTSGKLSTIENPKPEIIQLIDTVRKEAAEDGKIIKPKVN